MARKKRLASLGLAAAVLVWLAVDLAFYYAFHRPFTPQFAFQGVAAARDVLITGALFALGGALGSRLLPLLGVPPLARFAARAAAGLGGLGLLYLLLGTTLGTGTLLAWATWLVLAFWLRGEFVVWWADTADLRRIWKTSGKLGRTIAVLSALIFASSLLVALAPPLTFDSLVYHLSLPKIYLEQGQVGYVSDLTHWGFPQLAHMLMTWQGALGGVRGALVGWGMGLLAILGLVSHFSARLSPRRGWVAAAVLLCSASLSTALASAYVDWPAILLAWAMLLMLDLWLLKREPRFIIWAGVFCGLAFGVKYTAGLLAPLGAIAIWSLSKDWRAVMRFLAAAFVAAVPWLLRNWLATGNPFYPLLLPGGEMDALRLSYYEGFPAQGNWFDAILLALRATWLGLEGGRIGAAPGYETSLGPLLLGLGVFAALPARESKPARGLKRATVVLALGGLLFWAIAGRLSGHLIRSHLYFFLFPAFTALAVFGFAAAERIKVGGLRVGRILAAMICLAIGLNALQSLTALSPTGVLDLWTGTLDAQTYSEKNLGLYALVMGTLPAEANGRRVLMLWETRGYACVPLCDPDEVIDRWSHDLVTYGSPESVFEAWRDEGFEFVLFYKLGAQFVSADPGHFHAFDIEQVQNALEDLPLVRDYNGDYLLYSLKP